MHVLADNAAMATDMRMGDPYKYQHHLDKCNTARPGTLSYPHCEGLAADTVDTQCRMQ